MSDTVFAGSVPQVYEKYLVPQIFEAYAEDLVRRLAARPGSKRILEIAAGTGVLTRRMASELPADVEIVATDLSPAMIEQAQAVGTARPVEFRQADAMELPFGDASFDAVVVQFGVMFYPDRAKAHAEARRVLRPGGLYLFAVWDRIEDNEVADAVTAGLAEAFPENPPRFLPRAPYGYFDRAAIARDLAAGGFTAAPGIDTVTVRSRSASPRDAALGYCQGSPLRGELEALDPAGLERSTDAAAAEVARRLGDGPVDAKIQALVVSVERP